MVNKVKSHLKRFCTTAGKEHGFVSGRITDAYGLDKATRTIYLCEIKVNPTDLLKAVSQIHDTVSRFTPKDPKNTVIPVIAVPKRLFDEWGRYNIDKWDSFKKLCKTTHIAIWIIEQSTIRQIQGPKPKSPKVKTKKSIKTKVVAQPKIKRKTTKKLKPISKSKAAKTRKNSKRIKSRTKPKSTGKSKTAKKRKSAAKRPSSKSRVIKKR